ncbi:MAG: hypothetical protein C0621_07665 [Desulfuromonas sp.]|nr:MAG: hypothetical protein C0621_07665 [Desulfuromonas sp.]
MPQTPDLNPARLVKLVQTPMPFGRYAGTPLVDLPEPYVVWFAANGFPKGELGRMLQEVYEIKLNGLEYLFDPFPRPPRP